MLTKKGLKHVENWSKITRNQLKLGKNRPKNRWKLDENLIKMDKNC